MTVGNFPSTDGRYSRRGFLGLGAAAVGSALLAACGGGSSSGGDGKGLKFWDMIWGPAAYIKAATTLTEAYKPSAGHAEFSYQSIPWANFVQTFSSAIASKTGPAVSSGAGYQALQYFDQGAIAPADDLVAKLKAEDFLPGTLEPLKYQGSYVAVPWQVDIRVLYYRESLLEKAGADVPTDWDSFKAACVKLKKVGASGFGMAGGATTTLGSQQVLSMLYNNGGGMYDKDGRPDCVTDRNIETLDFLRELVSLGAIDKRFVSYTTDNFVADLTSGKIGMAFAPPGYESNFSKAQQSDFKVASPLSGPHGDKGTVSWINNLMMYKNAGSQADAEAFLSYYLDHMKAYWQQGLIQAMPVRKSIVELPEFQKNANNAKTAAEWQPVGKTEATLGTTLFPSLNAVDGGKALSDFAQQIIQGGTDSKTLLQKLQTGIEAVSK
ncbi:ABC transporter substrate-binding protein [Streptomyces albicerus]|uniref:ABC transporter substrate-binding protein n=1 Tax=Streptomyces albicerus TaxID=2569859 RepID=UPI00124B0DD5|nr:extracellular solute-binding protein [Streptomyces albicerus]